MVGLLFPREVALNNPYIVKTPCHLCLLTCSRSSGAHQALLTLRTRYQGIKRLSLTRITHNKTHSHS